MATPLPPAPAPASLPHHHHHIPPPTQKLVNVVWNNHYISASSSRNTASVRPATNTLNTNGAWIDAFTHNNHIVIARKHAIEVFRLDSSHNASTTTTQKHHLTLVSQHSVLASISKMQSMQRTQGDAIHIPMLVMLHTGYLCIWNYNIQTHTLISQCEVQVSMRPNAWRRDRWYSVSHMRQSLAHGHHRLVAIASQERNVQLILLCSKDGVEGSKVVRKGFQVEGVILDMQFITSWEMDDVHPYQVDLLAILSQDEEIQHLDLFTVCSPLESFADSEIFVQVAAYSIVRKRFQTVASWNMSNLSAFGISMCIPFHLPNHLALMVEGAVMIMDLDPWVRDLKLRANHKYTADYLELGISPGCDDRTNLVIPDLHEKCHLKSLHSPRFFNPGAPEKAVSVTPPVIAGTSMMMPASASLSPNPSPSSSSPTQNAALGLNLNLNLGISSSRSFWWVRGLEPIEIYTVKQKIFNIDLVLTKSIRSQRALIPMDQSRGTMPISCASSTFTLDSQTKHAIMVALESSELVVILGDHLDNLAIHIAGIIGPSRILLPLQQHNLFLTWNDGCDGALRQLVLKTATEQNASTFQSRHVCQVLNASPIIDFCMSKDRKTMYAACGLGKFGTLRVVQKGVGSISLAESGNALDFHGCSKVFAVRTNVNDAWHRFLVFSFASRTGVLGLGAQPGVLEDASESCCLRLDQPSVCVGTTGPFIIQVFESGVRAVCNSDLDVNQQPEKEHSERSRWIEYSLQMNQRIRVAAIDPIHGVFFELLEAGMPPRLCHLTISKDKRQFCEGTSTVLEDELSCMQVLPMKFSKDDVADSRVGLFLGTYKPGVELLTLQDGSLMSLWRRRLQDEVGLLQAMKDFSLQTTAAAHGRKEDEELSPSLGLSLAPQSVCGISLGSESFFLFVGLRDGTLLRYSLSPTELDPMEQDGDTNLNPKSFSHSIDFGIECVRRLGYQPVNLTPVQIQGLGAVLVISDQTRLVYMVGGVVHCSPLTYGIGALPHSLEQQSAAREPVAGASLLLQYAKTCLALISSGRLLLLDIPLLAEYDTKRYLLRETPHRLALIPKEFFGNEMVALATSKVASKKGQDVPSDGGIAAPKESDADQKMIAAEDIIKTLHEQFDIDDEGLDGESAGLRGLARLLTADHLVPIPTHYIQHSIRFFDPCSEKLLNVMFHLLRGESVRTIKVWNRFLVVGTAFGTQLFHEYGKECNMGRLLLFKLDKIVSHSKESQAFFETDKVGPSSSQIKDTMVIDAGQEKMAQSGSLLCKPSILLNLNECFMKSAVFELKLPGAVMASAIYGRDGHILLVSVNETLLALALNKTEDSLIELARIRSHSIIVSISVCAMIILVGDIKDSVSCFVFTYWKTGGPYFRNFSGDFCRRSVSDAIMMNSQLAVVADKQGRLTTLGKPEISDYLRSRVSKGFRTTNFGACSGSQRNLQEIHSINLDSVISRLHQGSLETGELPWSLTLAEVNSAAASKKPSRDTKAWPNCDLYSSMDSFTYATLDGAMFSCHAIAALPGTMLLDLERYLVQYFYELKVPGWKSLPVVESSEFGSLSLISSDSNRCFQVSPYQNDQDIIHGDLLYLYLSLPFDVQELLLRRLLEDNVNEASGNHVVRYTPYHIIVMTSLIESIVA